MKDVLLTDYLDEKRLQPFEWGQCDCILFVCDWAEKLTGINPAAGAHGQYDSELSAYKYLKVKYGNDPASHFDIHFQRVEENFRQKGDIALCMLDGKETFGICGARGFIFFKMAAGVVASTQVEIKTVWRVE